MSNTWQLQDAKNRFSEVVEKAVTEGPQHVTRRGKDTAVVLSSREYARLRRGRQSLVEFLRSAPLKGIALDRAKDAPRKSDS